MLLKNIGKTIKVMRELSGLRQGQLAKRVAVSSNYISLVENQRREPSLKFLKKVADELNLPISVFFWEDVAKSDTDNGREGDAAQEINRLFWDLVSSRLEGFKKDNGTG